jgi:spermidine synthase
MLGLTIAIIGAGGIIAQTILVRELLISFLGNELTLGIILGSWMLAEAAGALVIGWISIFIKDKKALLVSLMLVFSISLLAAAAGARVFKPLLGVPTGQGIGTAMILIGSFAALMPVAFCHGGLFSLCCSITTVTRTYILETAGTLAGGILLTWFLIPHFSHFELLWTTSAISIFVCVFCISTFTRRRTKIVLVPLVVACLLSVAMLKPAQIEQYTLARQYHQGKVLDYQNSWYGNVVVTQKEGQRVFFYNGIPAVTTPVPDLTFSREFGHLPLVFCKNPRDVMVIGAGLGGLVSEILMEPVKKIDYCQQDGLMVRMLWKYPSKLTARELTDPRLNVINEDARAVLRDRSNSYDAILIGSGAPADLASNRYFTEEFFHRAKGRLNPAGVFAMCLPGTLTYISPEQRDMNFMIINALRSQFGSIRIIPGDYNIILASDSPIFSIEPSELSSRLRTRKVQVPLLNPGYLKQRLDRQWTEWFNRSTAGATRLVNRDDKPVAVYQVLISWNKQFSGWTMAVLQTCARIRLWMILCAIGAGACALLAAARAWPKRARRDAVLFAVFSTGFFGMAMNLCIVFSFQMHYGYMYQMIGALNASFMAGIAAGSIGMRYAAGRFKQPWDALAANEAAIVFYSLISLVIIARVPYGIYAAPLYFILSFFAGALAGSEFPLAVVLYGGKQGSTGGTAGVVFCSDLVGGVGAALLGGVILLPLLGITNMLCTLAALKAAAAFIVGIRKKVK